jgi:hypothetical protein
VQPHFAEDSFEGQHPIEFVRPRADDRVLIEVVHCSHDAMLEFLFGCHPDVAQDGSRELGKEALAARILTLGRLTTRCQR